VRTLIAAAESIRESHRFPALRRAMLGMKRALSIVPLLEPARCGRPFAAGGAHAGPKGIE